MKKGEVKHLDKMNELVVDRRVRPSALLPLWDIGGFVLGTDHYVLFVSLRASLLAVAYMPAVSLLPSRVSCLLCVVCVCVEVCMFVICIHQLHNVYVCRRWHCAAWETSCDGMHGCC